MYKIFILWESGKENIYSCKSIESARKSAAKLCHPLNYVSIRKI